MNSNELEQMLTVKEVARLLRIHANTLRRLSLVGCEGANRQATSGQDKTLHKTRQESVTWSKTFGGPESDSGQSVQQASDGGYIVAGYTTVLEGLHKDVYLIKTDGDGNEEWTRTFGGPGSDSAESVQQTSDGGYIIAGHTTSYGAGPADAP